MADSEDFNQKAGMKIAPKNWQSFQHYKDRDPPWIKLHKKLLDNFEFQSLPLASKALAPMLWLLASEHKDGVIDADPAYLAFRLRWSLSDVTDALTPLIKNSFFFVIQPASTSLALVVQNAIPETETETETEDSAEPPSDSTPPVASFPLVDGSEFGVNATLLSEWQKSFPAVDVMQELREIRAWCLANPARRKTRSGAQRFVVRWLSKEQDKGGGRVSAMPRYT